MGISSVVIASYLPVDINQVTFQPIYFLNSTIFFSEEEKMRRWQEIRIRQNRLLAEAEQTTPAHIEQIMKSGFTMNDIKGLHRNFEDSAEDEMLSPTRGIQKSSSRASPSRPPRRSSLSRYDDNGMEGILGKHRSTSELDLNAKDKKTRGRSPFR